MTLPMTSKDDRAPSHRRPDRDAWVDALERGAARACAPALGEHSRGELHRGAIHEMRNALNVIQGWSQLLALAGRKPELAVEAAAVLRRNVRDQEELLEAMQDIGPGACDAGGDRNPINLGGVVASARESAEHEAHARSVEVRMVADPEGTTVLGNPSRLLFIARRLILNAVQASPARGLVTVEVAASPRSVRLLVTDEGSRLIEDSPPCPFERLRRDAEGTTPLDFFLAMIRLRVESLGGCIAARSPEFGPGATFAVLLPRPGQVRHPEAMEGECLIAPTDRPRPEESTA